MIALGRIIFLLACLRPAIALGSGLSSEELETKAKLENSIQENLENTISTRLLKGDFTVGVSVQLKPIPPAQTPEPPKPPVSDKPLGLDLGTINVEEIIASYDKQLEELKIKQKNENNKNDDKKTRFSVESISIDVGLSDSYGEEYRKTFAQWLQEKSAHDYGSSVHTQASLIQKPLPNEPERKPDLWERLKEIQSLLGLLILGLLLGMAIWLASRSLIRAAREQHRMTLQPEGTLDVESTQQLEEPESETTAGLPAPAAERLASSADQESLVTKVAFVCMELNSKLNELVRVWIDAGEEGYLKTALLVDAMMTAREKMLTQAGAMPMLQIPIDQDLVVSREEHLAEAYRRITQMDFTERLPVLESIYWDLISVRTLGLQSLRRPFDFLSGLPTDQIGELLQAQKQESRALALLYMNEEARHEIFEKAEPETKEKLVGEVLAHSQMSQQKIWDSDTALKVTAMALAEPTRDKLVNLFPRTLEVLSVLNSLEEIQILRNVSRSLPDGGYDLKTQYPSLAFIDEWRPEFVRKLMANASSDEVTGLIRALPAIRDSVLEQCPPKVKLIIEDDLRMATSVETNDLAPRIESLKTKWLRLVQSEKIQLTKVLQGDAPGGSHVKAA